MDASMRTIVEAIPGWRGRHIEVSELSGGLTNRNYLVRVDGEPAVVRVPGTATDLLAVDRANERHNTRAAATTGIGPRILHELPGSDVVVLEFIHGRTMSNASLGEPGMPGRIAASLRRLHAGPRFLRDFNMFRLVEFYLRIVDERGVPIPDGYRERLPLVARIEEALAARPLNTVPCHNDLLAENYIDDGNQLRIVDYEYSGNNDPCFELGNTCQELGYEEARIRELCGAYFGSVTRPLLARTKLQMIMSDVGWTLWAAIQARISTIEYDFRGWAMERWDRAEAKLAAPAFESWLADVRLDPASPEAAIGGVELGDA